MGDKRTLSHSSMACMRQCPRQYYYRYMLRLSKIESAQALRFGSAWHKIMEEKRRHPEKGISDFIPMMKEMPLNAPERIAIHCLAEGYFNYYQNSEEYAFEAVELDWTIPLKNPLTGGVSRTFELTGKIDAVDTRGYVWETKTTSDSLSGESDLWTRLRMDPQISLYYYVRSQMGGATQGIVYDVVKKPGLRFAQAPMLDENGLKIVINDETGERCMNKNGSPRQTGGDGMTLKTREETPEELTVRLRQDIQDRPEFYFQQRYVTRLEEDIQDLLLEIWDQAKALQQSITHKRWFRNVNRFTCSGCEYAALCLHSVEVDPSAPAPTGYCFNKEKETANASN